LLHGLIIGIVVVALALLAGRIYQLLGAARDTRRFPPLGEMVDIGGHRLHLVAAGEGGPTVVFESGLMATVLTWNEIQPEIAKAARTICYDRAGLGWSEPGPMPRDANRIVSELHDLLDRASLPPPYILVGHSFGGLTTRLFAARYSQEVAGLVLLDPVVPGEWNPVSEHNQKRIRTGARILRRAAAMSRWGALRFVSFLLRTGIKPIAEPLVRLMSKGAPKGDGTTKSPLFWNLPPSERALTPVFWVQPKFTETIASQLENLPRSSSQLAEVENLADKPVVVLSAGDTPPQRLQEHIAIAGLSSQGKHLVAKKSGHWVMVDEPELVLNAIREMLDWSRRPRVIGARN